MSAPRRSATRCCVGWHPDIGGRGGGWVWLYDCLCVLSVHHGGHSELGARRGGRQHGAVLDSILISVAVNVDRCGCTIVCVCLVFIMVNTVGSERAEAIGNTLGLLSRWSAEAWIAPSVCQPFHCVSKHGGRVCVCVARWRTMLCSGNPFSVASPSEPLRLSLSTRADRVSPPAPTAQVGYSIRMESKRSRHTRLLFCTTGVMLRRMQGDRRAPWK